MTCNWEVMGSNQGWNTDYPKFSNDFLSVQAHAKTASHIRSHVLLPHSLQFFIQLSSNHSTVYSQ